MAIAAFSTAGFSNYIAASSGVSASQQALQSMQQSLVSGNLKQAQSAFNTYQQLNQGTTATTGTASSTTATVSQFSKDLTALGTAIGSGSLSTAQAALATLQSDLKGTPSQAVTNAEAAVAQTVTWVDDLLNLNGSSSANAVPVDPTTSILDSAYGDSASSTATTNPTTNILESAYGTSSSGTSAAASTPTSATSGNLGSGSSVNAYA